MAAPTTPATREKHLPTARPRRYPSDTSDAEWAVMAPHVPAGTGRGRPHRCRRTVRDYERRPDHHAAMVQRALIIVMTRRLARHQPT